MEEILKKIGFIIVVLCLFGCKEDVSFAPAIDEVALEAPQGLSPEEPIAVEPPPVDPVDPVVPPVDPVDPPILETLPLGPKVALTRRPVNHFVGDSTRVAYEVVKGDSEIETIECLIDGQPISCQSLAASLELGKPERGKHKFSIKVTDELGLSDEKEVSWESILKLISQKQGVEIEKKDNRADVLFVVDNSISMQEEQQGIADRIGRFFSRIRKLDWRIGIITTDPYEINPRTREYNPLADGALLKFPDGNYFLESKMGEAKAKDLFQKTIFRPEQGNGHERGIRNLVRSIERATNPIDLVDQRLTSFFRAPASLSVVLISDENETRRDGGDTLFSDYGKSDAGNLVNLVEKKWGSKKLFQFNSVIVRPGDRSCIGQDESYGTEYAKASELTDGVIADICADDYSDALRKIGNSVVNLKKVFKLSCVAQDKDNDGKVDVKVTSPTRTVIPRYTVSGDQVEFSTALDVGKYEFSYYCVD